MAHNLHDIEPTLAIFQQSGPKLWWRYMHSNNFWPKWPQICIISHALHQFFMKLAQNICNLPQSGANPTPTRTIFVHNGPDFFRMTCASSNLHHSGKNPTPTWTFFGNTGPDFSIMACAFNTLHHSGESSTPTQTGIMTYFPQRGLWIWKTTTPSKTLFP